MKWRHIQENWPAFYGAIIDKWPDVDEAGLDEVDGDQRAFLEYLADVTGQDAAEVCEDVRDWLVGEIPSDIVMDPIHDNHSISLSAKYVNEGEDEFDDDGAFGDDGNDD